MNKTYLVKIFNQLYEDKKIVFIFCKFQIINTNTLQLNQRPITKNNYLAMHFNFGFFQRKLFCRFFELFE